jgi:pyrroloquinoline quinone biosynthesis protein D
MSPHDPIRRPVLVHHARYRWDELRRQHQLVFPEGVLVLNETAAAVVRLCSGRSMEELVAALEQQFPGSQPAADVRELLQRLARKGLLRDAADT